MWSYECKLSISHNCIDFGSLYHYQFHISDGFLFRKNANVQEFWKAVTRIVEK